jgi:hypothetical protein
MALTNLNFAYSPFVQDIGAGGAHGTPQHIAFPFEAVVLNVENPLRAKVLAGTVYGNRSQFTGTLQPNVINRVTNIFVTEDEAADLGV